MAKKRKTTKIMQRSNSASTESPTSSAVNSAQASPLSRRINTRSHTETLEPNPQLRHESEDEFEQDSEAFSPPRKRCESAKSGLLQTEDVPLNAKELQRVSLPPIELKSLRRSSRGTALRSGPQAYSSKWHPVDDLKSSSKNDKDKEPASEESKTPRLKSFTNSASATLTTHDGQKEPSQLFIEPDKLVSHLPCRRSSRIVHDADIAMKYDMSSHWASRRFTDPHAFAKRLEKKRRSLASMAAREGSLDNQPASPHPGNDATLPQIEKSYNDHIVIATKSTNSRNRLDQKHHESSLGIDTPLAPTSPAVLADNLEGELLPNQEPDCLPNTVLPAIFSENEVLDTLLEPFFPTRESPKLEFQSLDWNKLSNCDRRLYSLQKGFPLNGNSLPFPWRVVKEKLIKEGFKKEFDAKDRSEESDYVQDRYESVRLGIEAFFKAPPEPEEKQDWTLFRTESFDVYHKNKGRKYWKRSGDNIIKPLEISPEVSFLQLLSDPQVQAQKQLDTLTGHLHQVKETSFTKSVDVQGMLVTETQIDKFLALAEPAEETESLARLNTVTPDLPGDTPIDDNKISPEQSETTLMDLMRTNDSLSMEAAPAFNFEEVEIVPDEDRSIQDNWLSSMREGPKYSYGTSSPPPKRRKRKVAEDFSIHEDDALDIAVTTAAQGDEDRISGRERGLDLPVENMSAAELIPGSQERVMGLLSRTQYRLGTASLGGPQAIPIWVDGNEHASVSNGPYR